MANTIDMSSKLEKHHYNYSKVSTENCSLKIYLELKGLHKIVQLQGGSHIILAAQCMSDYKMIFPNTTSQAKSVPSRISCQTSCGRTHSRKKKNQIKDEMAIQRLWLWSRTVYRATLSRNWHAREELTEVNHMTLWRSRMGPAT